MRYKPPKTPLPRMNWRDPNMPVIRDYTMANGTKKVEVDPDYERRYREFMMGQFNGDYWKSDPTYNARKK